MSEMPEVKSNPTMVSVTVTVKEELLNRLLRYSSLSFTQRVVAWIWRYITRLRRHSVHQGPLKRAELQKSLNTLVYVTQQHYFSNWTTYLTEPSHDGIPKSYRALKPFLDKSGIIRVGGRLRHPSLEHSAKFPILVPKTSHLAHLILQYYHICYLHAGPKLLLSTVSRIFWITSARREIHKVIKGCVTCTKWAAVRPQPVMADLPVPRVTPNGAFCHVGVDYGGPFMVRESRRRKSKEYRSYMALFICLSIKAVHIETVTELSTDAFLAAFGRFVARRGIPTDVYSDYGTNFIGADRQLQTLLKQEEAQNKIINTTACNWHFNPPAAPHFEGLWEAGIKSANALLKRSIRTQVHTYEELTTLLIRVEAILNSRPLTPLSSDPHETDCLTPGHLLIGQPLIALPEQDVTDINQNRLSRWQFLQQCHQNFWKRWSSEYLSTLQERSKWDRTRGAVTVNDVVIIRTPNVPPTVWRTGRVIQVHPGEDGVVRVVILKTANGEIKRPVVQVVKLPTNA